MGQLPTKRTAQVNPPPHTDIVKGYTEVPVNIPANESNAATVTQPPKTVFKKCCCCVNLRRGAIVISILQILSGIGALARSGGDVATIIGGIVALAAGGCLNFGAIKYNHVATLINLIFTMISIVGGIILAILMFIAGAAVTSSSVHRVYLTPEEKDVGTFAMILGAAYIIGSLLNLYFWLCVFSFWKVLKSGVITSPA